MDTFRYRSKVVSMVTPMFEQLKTDSRSQA